MKNSFNYYRIKTEWVTESADGSLQKVKTEELVYASSYTEAEKVAYALVEEYNRTRYADVKIEIIKTKITELLFNDVLSHDEELICGMVNNYFSEAEDSGVGIYSVKLMIITIDEKSGKEIKTSETIFTPASSNTDAASKIAAAYQMSDYVIRDIKFDKAEAVLWPHEIQQQKQTAYDLK